MVAIRTPDVIAFVVLMAGTWRAPGEEINLAQIEAISRSSGVPEPVIAKNQEIQRRVLAAIVEQESDPKVRTAKLQEMAEQISCSKHMARPAP